MASSTLTLLVLTACIGWSQQQSMPRCLLSRLDRIPCEYDTPCGGGGIEEAGPNNQFSIHYTLLRRTNDDEIECCIRRRDQRIKTITTVGSDDTKVIYSPGFILDRRYDNQLLGRFNIDCGDRRIAFFNLTTIDMQDNDCEQDNVSRCQDYVLIDRGFGGTTEVCGNTSTRNSVLQLQSGGFRVFFRSSEVRKFAGFRMFIVCVNEGDTGEPGCLKTADFDVCGERFRRDSRGRRRKRLCGDYIDGIRTYQQLFPEYPPGLRIRRDVATFHRPWRFLRPKAYRFIQRIVLYSESLNYSNGCIQIAGGVKTSRYTDVSVLRTFDTKGNIATYVYGVRSSVFPHFFGPGPLVIVDRYAYFQMFLIDPRGIIPTPEEQQELLLINEALFNAIPESADSEFNDPNLNITDFSDLGYERRRRSLYSAKGDANKHWSFEPDIEELIALDDEIYYERLQRQTTVPPPPFSTETAFAALRGREACNPVLRQQSLSLLQIYESNEITKQMLNNLRNFAIECFLRGNLLNCVVNEGFAPALERALCTPSDLNIRTECRPFYEPFAIFSFNLTSVTVEATNCNGQKAVFTTTQSGF